MKDLDIKTCEWIRHTLGLGDDISDYEIYYKTHKTFLYVQVKFHFAWTGLKEAIWKKAQ